MEVAAVGGSGAERGVHLAQQQHDAQFYQVWPVKARLLCCLQIHLHSCQCVDQSFLTVAFTTLMHVLLHACASPLTPLQATVVLVEDVLTAGTANTETQTDRQTDRQAGRQTDRQTGRQAGRQVDRKAPAGMC